MIFSLTAALLLSHVQSSVEGRVYIGNKPAKNVVVWIEEEGKPSPIKASVVQQGKVFRPHVLVVPVGSIVDFPNRDDLFHNVFAEYNAKKFDLGQYPKGQTRKVVFDRPGQVSVLCNIHAEMSAFILVVNSNHYAITNDQGNFSLKNIKGSVQLHYWHESGKKGVKTVNAGESLELRL